MKQLEQARILLAKAAEDQRAVNALLGHDGISESIVGFHCQQAAEKLLKALLSAHGVVFRHRHDLSELMEILEQSGHPLPVEFRPVEVLTRFAVELRYDLFENHDDFDCQAAMNLVRRLQVFVESEMARVSS